YEPSRASLQALQILQRGYRYVRHPDKIAEIYSIALMGSTGTIGHSGQSDMDIWVCYAPDVSANRVADLQEKLIAISQWADTLGLEVHFFPMNAQEFREGERNSLSGEDCGSAQHYLLLDEFYRTGLLLAGRYPIWWLVPPAQEADYDLITTKLVEKKFIPAEELVDFGGVSHFPAGEFIGAGMWQLYKGIDSPYKSVLKIALTEAYAAEHPCVTSCSLRYKRAIYSGVLDLDELDPYIMVYRKLEEYLGDRGEAQRLDLVRRCLYFKAGESLSRSVQSAHRTWRRDLMEKMVREWGWDSALIEKLDNRKRWRVDRVLNERKLLVNELNHCYRFLSNFARQNQTLALISKQDMNILGRKLYAAFERKAGKIELINPGITPDLAEEQLSLHYVDYSEANEQNNTGAWLLYRGYLKEKDALGEQPIKRTRGLIELLSWCYFNKLIDASTRFFIEPGKSDLSELELQQTITSLQQQFPYESLEREQVAFESAAYPIHIALYLNAGVDPMSDLTRKGIHRLSNQTDALSYSALHNNLALSVEQVQVNSWGEIITARYDADSAVIDCVLEYMRLLPPKHDFPTPRLDIRCFCKNRAMPIASRIEALFKDIQKVFYSPDSKPRTRFVVEIERTLYLLQIGPQGPKASAAATPEALYDLLSETQDYFSSVIVDEHVTQLPELSAMVKQVGPDRITVFYLRRAKEVEVFIFDERGSMKRYAAQFDNEQHFLVPLNLFLKAVSYRQLNDAHISVHSAELRPVVFYELIQKSKNSFTMERRKPTPGSENSRYLNVQAIVEKITEGELIHTIYCDHQEFSQLEFGEDIYYRVAAYISSRRRSGGHYPFYITDLDLSRVSEESNNQLQTVQYLNYKCKIEDALNAAIQRM
ncbi:MAG TPA: class I adenylate cyclase, partial [Pseudomonadales bacterium]|nr:class I adenylate cyclase [Pseudomonadales bacterium]